MVRVSMLSKVFSDRGNEVAAVDGVSFEVPEGSLFTLLGPSGCGKTTTLRCIAGLEYPDSGEIEIAGRTVYSSESRTSVGPDNRPIGMVFQNYAIWPHMNVYDNVAFPLRVGKGRFPRSEIRRKVEEALALVELSGLEDRPAPQLSGGQQQRLALARALVREPKVLLLDEPLSNLDARLRDHMRKELRDLQQRLQITTVFVTHDQIEALSMSDRVAVMNEGRIVQEGTPREIYQAPQTQFVAQFIGSTNVLSGRPDSGPKTNGYVRIETSLGQIECRAELEPTLGEELRMAIRPEDVVIHRDAHAAANVLVGKITRIDFLGGNLDCQVAVDGSTLFVREHPSAALEVNQAVWLELPPAACRILS